MNGKVGRNLREQKAGQPVSAKAIDQFRPIAQAFLHLGIGQGLAEQRLPGGASLLRTVGVQTAYGQAGPDGIPGRDDSDLANIKPGQGFGYIYVRTEGDVLSRRAELEPIENVYDGTVAAGYFPMLLVKIDGRWSVSNIDCVSVTPTPPA